MKIKDILSVTYAVISKFSKSRLLRTIQFLREKCIELSEKNSKLEAENKKLKEELKKQKIQCINKDANKPSSKRPEWDKKGVGNDCKEKKNRKGRGKKPRKGAGNRPKNLKPDRIENATVDHCTLCGKDFKERKCSPEIITKITKPFAKLMALCSNFLFYFFHLACLASLRSYAVCKFSQNSALVPKKRENRSAVSAVMERAPFKMAVMRFGGT